MTGGLARDLAEILGPEAVLEGEAARPYQRDSTEMQGLAGRADAVALPSEVEQVRRLVAWCYERGVGIVPRGGGTGFAGGAVPVEGGVVLSLERLDRVLRFDPELWRMQVEAGVRTGRVHRLARESGLLFPPDPGAAEQSTIGGNVACNAGGPHSFKYGVTAHWVTGLEAVVAGGELIRVGGPLRKDVAGLDLRSLLIGSEGTLGVIVRIWLRLTPAPEALIPVVAAYPGVEAGVAGLGRVYGYGLVPAALEYFDPGAVAATRAAFPGGLPEATGFLVVAEADGTRQAAEALAAELAEALGEGALEVRRLGQPGEIRELWRWRSGVSFAVSAQLGGKMSEDVAVPVDRLGEAIAMVGEVGREHGLRTCSWGHAGDGNLHATFMIDASSPEQVARATAAASSLFARTLALGGTVSGEHGLGWVKREQFDRQFGPAEAALQRSIKALFDPRGLFNPGKKLPPAG
ncbi:MAG TPA: FAD-linked oxidase C-terminal domain-containing protein [Candidatus Dormibacteraeota bacterium]|nr:FAD-linked oxidase C-terminal domain-containing protein [Candidatus Dormibacteraeota bacterium]